MDWKHDGSDNDRIRAWLCDEENEFNCEECPYYMGPYRGSGFAYPCGQQNCLVTMTCR